MYGAAVVSWSPTGGGAQIFPHSEQIKVKDKSFTGVAENSMLITECNKRLASEKLLNTIELNIDLCFALYSSVS